MKNYKVISIRILEKDIKKIDEASKLVKRNRSDFIRLSSINKADEIIKNSDEETHGNQIFKN